MADRAEGGKTHKSGLWSIAAHFGTWRAVALKPKDLKAYIEKRRAKGKSNATINRELELLRRALRLAHEQGQLPTEVKVPMLEENNTRTGFATRPQLETIVTHLPEWLPKVRHGIAPIVLAGFESVGRSNPPANLAPMVTSG